MSENSRHVGRPSEPVEEPQVEQPEANPDEPAEPTETQNTFKRNPERMQSWIDYNRTKGDNEEADRTQTLLDAFNSSDGE